jgi:hypothetical protein
LQKGAAVLRPKELSPSGLHNALESEIGNGKLPPFIGFEISLDFLGAMS